MTPAVTGTATVGNALSASTGTWTDADNNTLTYSYQWYRATDAAGTGAAAISGATSASYTLTTADAHKFVKVVVTANDANGSSTVTAESTYTDHHQHRAGQQRRSGDHRHRHGRQRADRQHRHVVATPTAIR